MRKVLLLILLMAVPMALSAQADKSDVRRGNRRFAKKDYRQSDIFYRKALVKDSLSFAANYNLANNLYRQGNFDEAAKYYDKAVPLTPQKGRRASEYAESVHFGRGDAALAKKDWQGAVDAFRQAILQNPDDVEAKENYIYARKKLQEQRSQQNRQDQDNQNNQDNQDNKDNQNKDQQDQDKDRNQNQDQNQNQNQDQNQDNQQQDKPDGQDGRQPQPKVSPQQAQQMLKAIQAREKETQDKVNREKAAVLKSKQKDKNW